MFLHVSPLSTHRQCFDFLRDNLRERTELDWSASLIWGDGTNLWLALYGSDVEHCKIPIT